MWSTYAYILNLSTLPMETLSFYNRSISQRDLKNRKRKIALPDSWQNIIYIVISSQRERWWIEEKQMQAKGQ